MEKLSSANLNNYQFQNKLILERWIKMIKDLSDKGRVPRIGKIHLGIRKKSSKGIEYPSAVDYFVCPDEVKAVYGEQPKKLKITFHTNNIDEIFPQFYKRYGKSTGLACRGDGEVANAINVDTGEMNEIECIGRECAYYKENDCKQIGNLYFMILGVNRFGVYQLDTSSYNTILNINGGLQFAMKLTGGRLALIPFFLEVVPQEVNPNGKKKTVYVLRLEADVQNLMKAMNQAPSEILAIESPKTKDIEEDLYTKDLVSSIKPVEDDLKALWDKAQEIGYSKEEFKVYIKDKCGVDSLKDLNKEQYDKVFTDLTTELDEFNNGEIIDGDLDAEIGQGVLIK